MWRFPRLSVLLAPILIIVAVETVYALADGSYWEVPPDRPYRDFPMIHDPAVGFAGGEG